MIKIGNLNLSSCCVLAPMSGVSDLSFRLLNREFGCELAFVEMLNVRSLGHKSRRTAAMLSADAKDRPLGLQLLGKDTKFILRALDILREYTFDVLDFNAACPERKVTTRGEGAALLKEPKALNKLLKVIVKNAWVPVTAKIRIGWDKDSVSGREIARCAEDAGVNALFVHGRTKAQGYSGRVNYKSIKEVKEALSIPVIASGDVFSAFLAKKMFDETGCNGVLVARGALGNPWIFREIDQFLRGGKVAPKPDINEIIITMVRHLNLCVDLYGERVGVVIYRKFFAWYTRGLRRVRGLREKAYHAKTKSEMGRIIEESSISYS